MRQRGAGFVIAAVMLFAIGDVTRTGWVQVADALLWGAIIVSAIVPWFSGARVDASPRFMWSRRQSGMPGPVQGAALGFSVTLVNRRPWPRFGLVLTYRVRVNGKPGSPVKLYVQYLAPRATRVITGDVEAGKRGLYEADGGLLSADAPLGMFRRRQRCFGQASVLVLPAPVPVDVGRARRVPAGSRARPVTVRRGDEVSGSRPFAAGDAVRDIHWRNTARAGRLMTKSYTHAASDAPLLLYAAPDDEAMDDVVRVVAGVAHWWGIRGTPVHVQEAHAVRQVAWDELLHVLARAMASGPASLARSLGAVPHGTGAAVVLCADDRGSLAALMAAAPRLADARAWVLAPPLQAGHDDTQGRGAVAMLRGAGVDAELVTRSLPPPGARPGSTRPLHLDARLPSRPVRQDRPAAGGTPA